MNDHRVKWASAAAVWALANLPLAWVWFTLDGTGVRQAVRLYPGQFVFLAAPFLGAAIFTWAAWRSAAAICAGADADGQLTGKKIPAPVDPRRRAHWWWALGIAAGCAVCDYFFMPVAVYGWEDASTRLAAFDQVVAADAADLPPVAPPASDRDAGSSGAASEAKVGLAQAMSARSYDQRWPLVVLEGIELAAVVFTAYHLFAAAVLLAYLRRACRSKERARLAACRCAAIDVMAALLFYLAWPPLFLATVYFMNLLDPRAFPRALYSFTVLAVGLAMIFCLVFVACVFISKTGAKAVWGLVTLLITGALSYIGLVEPVLVYQALAAPNTLMGLAIVAGVAGVALYLAYGYLIGISEQEDPIDSLGGVG